MANKRVDVVSIGAGWTASIMGWKLCEAGLNWVAIEQGPGRWANPGFQHNHDPLRFHGRHAMMVNLRKETWSWRPNPTSPSLPMRQYGSFNPGQGVGGAAVHWTAQLWRFHPEDFRYRSHHIERYGESKLPEGNRIRDWPLTYEELEPYYDEFEWDIGASGTAGNVKGEIRPGGNPFEGPRSRPYRHPPLTTMIPSEMWMEKVQEMGLHPFPYPSGITSRAFEDRFGNRRAACIYCGFCTRYGCEVDAKTSPQTTHLPAALKTGRFEIRTNSKVTRINLDKDGRATGVTYIDADGKEQVQDAAIVMVTGFTLTNSRMMLVSKGEAHPAGIGNDRGLVGKNYTYQQFGTPVKGHFPGRGFNLYMGNGTTAYCIHDYYGDVFDHSNEDFIGGAMMWCSLGERDPVTSAGSFPIGSDLAWGKEWKDGLRDQWNSTADIGFEGESLPYEDQFLDLDPTYKAADGQPLLRLTFDWHENDRKLYAFLTARAKEQMQRMNPATISSKDERGDYNIHDYQSTHPTGGLIMGTDPGNSVTNSYGQVWDTPNVFVTGAALYPQNPGANPTDTLCALAYRAGDAIRDQYFKNEGRLIA